MKSVSFCIVVLGVFFASCKKSGHLSVTSNTTTPPPLKGSAYTKLMAGRRSFRQVTSGYDPIKTKAYSDTATVSIDVVYKDDATVIFDSEGFVYDADSPGAIYFHSAASDQHTYFASLKFNHLTNELTVTRDRHISAAAGDVITKYWSL